MSLSSPLSAAAGDPRGALLRLIGVLAWSDLHFYAVHSALHVIPTLYKNVHKVHHESINTNPLSGLSFHPLESLLYFTSLLLPLLSPASPSELRALKIGLVLAPIGGHIGYSLNPKVHPHHYLHHTKFNFNYGAGLAPEGLLMDFAMGTVYRGRENGY